ncbi:SUMO-activating enzyme subunit 2-like isoform X2 [Anneissia japonica]|uniref:SUMO-activating enzyme subunit 2-like isoform X2 n=1 Tax=Anneissia japonica TaxID=1529436 RepID=UPI00142597FE|nr:SUMO-activating enzyme subunit 2-like isoform X2 [Anneissia japonica]
MAASVRGILPDDTAEMVSACKVLVVGAGGIGCELLKNLVLTGFTDIVVIDLDTIDVSNLNRQFLFQKKHVGKSKAQVAKESALKFNPNVRIDAKHDSIMNPDFSAAFFKQFTLVMNALDNRAARNHVNRMCLAADVPLVESGTAGYLGQVTVIKKTVTECYECHPKPVQKTFPGCTIRNTPSEPVHCIVWAKHLFNQLFGEEDPDQDVSPDTADPEAAGDAGKAALEGKSNDSNSVGGIARVSTRAWAESTDYNSEKLFRKLFHDDIKYLLSMDKLWKKRKPPTPLNWDQLPPEEPSSTTNSNGAIKDQRVWDVRECVDKFTDSLANLKQQYKDQGELTWDKDNPAAMDFVTAAANIRCQIFGIARKSRFKIKSMAGNIIPAIATTNAVIAGIMVMEALKILSGHLDKCKTVYLNKIPNARKKFLVPCNIEKPNPKCYVCSSKPEVTVQLNCATFTIKMFEEKVLKSYLGMVAPDVEVEDGKGTILISSEEGETEDNNDKFLSDFSIKHSSRLKADDFLQNYTLVINIEQCDSFEEEVDFKVVGEKPRPISEKESVSSSVDEKGEGSSQSSGNKTSHPEPSMIVDDEDDIMVIDVDQEAQPSVSKKRKHSDDIDVIASKKSKVTSQTSNGDDDTLIIDP